MQLPIKFKYFTLDRGTVQPTREGEKPFEGYTLKDNNGIQIAGGTSLGALVAHGQQSDIAMEIASQWVARKLPILEHLSGVDIDAQPDQPAGLMVPPHMLPPGTKH